MEYIPDISVLVAFSLAATLLALTPGPDMTLFIGRTLTQGKAAGLACLFGASTGTIIHTFLAVLGISALLAASPTGFWVLKILGAVYLLWLAFQALVSGSTFSLNDKPAKTTGLMKNYMFGIGVNMLNPKIILFYMTFLPQFVDANDPAAWKKMLFLGLYFSAFTLPMMAAIIMAADGLSKRLISNPKISRGIDYLFATVFGVFAVKILLTEGR